MSKSSPALLGVCIHNYGHLLRIQKAFSKSFATTLLNENIATCKKVIIFYETYYPISFKRLFAGYSNKSIFEFCEKIVHSLMTRRKVRIQAKRRARKERNDVVLRVFQNYTKTHKSTKNPKSKKMIAAAFLPA